jgi:hypothetical protein
VAVSHRDRGPRAVDERGCHDLTRVSASWGRSGSSQQHPLPPLDQPTASGVACARPGLACILPSAMCVCRPRVREPHLTTSRGSGRPAWAGPRCTGCRHNVHRHEDNLAPATSTKEPAARKNVRRDVFHGVTCHIYFPRVSALIRSMIWAAVCGSRSTDIDFIPHRIAAIAPVPLPAKMSSMVPPGLPATVRIRS